MSAREWGLWLAEYRRTRFAPPELAAPEEDPVHFLARTGGLNG
jgi:hypothetical protein